MNRTKIIIIILVIIIGLLIFFSITSFSTPKESTLVPITTGDLYEEEVSENSFVKVYDLQNVNFIANLGVYNPSSVMLAFKKI